MALPRHPHAEPQTISPDRLPVFDTPFTRVSEHWMTNQGTTCQDYEMDYIKCAAHVGGIRAERECKKYLEDWMECRYKIKTAKRYMAMLAERKNQKRPHIETPPPDSIYTPVDHD